MTQLPSPQRRREIVDALRRGTVPRRNLDAFAVGLDRFEAALTDQLQTVRAGQSDFKAVRGEYGSGKTFFARWLQESAKRQGFATAEVQISETETPLHKLETVYRRLTERLSTSDQPEGALRSVLDAWFYSLEEDVLAGGEVAEDDVEGLLQRTDALMEQRLASVTQHNLSFAAALRAYRRARAEENHEIADGLLAWLSGEPNVGAAAKRYAGIKGDLDHFGALTFLKGLLVILRDAGFAGLVLVLDEVETLQRVRSDVREKSLNALRQLLDEIDGGRFQGLFLVITGTPAFFEGPQGVQRLQPLAQRLHVDFQTDARFDNPRAVQIRLTGFDRSACTRSAAGSAICTPPSARPKSRIRERVDEAYVDTLARAVTGDLGGKVGVAPRIFLKKLVEDVLDRVDQFDDFDPRQHYQLTVNDTELSVAERAARSAEHPDDIEF